MEKVHRVPMREKKKSPVGGFGRNRVEAAHTIFCKNSVLCGIPIPFSVFLCYNIRKTQGKGDT